MIDRKQIASVIEHSLLRPATSQDIETLCHEAIEHGFYAVCINPFYADKARELLSGSGVKVCSVIDFPLGSSTTKMRVYEAIELAMKGVDEIDIVMNIGAAKDGLWDVAENDLTSIIMATPRLIHKVILETCYLTDEEKRKACRVCIRAGAEFIKTSTGFAEKGATVEDVRLLKDALDGRAGIKAAGGIKALKDVIALMDAGATKIGTSSGIKILKEAV